jgi:hypothetical protein
MMPYSNHADDDKLVKCVTAFSSALHLGLCHYSSSCSMACCQLSDDTLTPSFLLLCVLYVWCLPGTG